MIKLLKALFFGSLVWATPAFALNIVTSTQDLASITEAIGGADVTVTYIVRGDLDPHFVEAKPSYMVKLSKADLYVAVGMDLEVGWLPSLLTGSRNPKIQPGTAGYLDASRAIRPIEVPTGTIDRSRGDLHPAGNPHYWLAPENGRLVARAIEQKLEALDPTHAAHFKANLAAFEAKLNTKIAEWKTKMAPLNGASVVGYHSTFDYFLGAYGLKIVGFVEPKPGIAPTPSHTLEVSAAAKAAKAKFILVEQFHDPRDAGPVARASGAKVLTVPTAVGAMDGINDYFGLFDRIVTLMNTP